MEPQQASDNCFAVVNEKNLVCDANAAPIHLGGGVVFEAVLAVARAKGIAAEF